MKSPRGFFTSIGKGIVNTTEYLAQKRKGFKHDDATSLRIEQFEQMRDAHVEFNEQLKTYFETRKKVQPAEAQMAEALSALALHDFPGEGPASKSASKWALERKEISSKFDQWNVGFETIVGTSDELLREMDALRQRVDELNKEVVELETERKAKEPKDLKEKENSYAQNTKQLMDDIVACMNKKDELVARWIGKWTVLDSRLHATQSSEPPQAEGTTK